MQTDLHKYVYESVSAYSMHRIACFIMSRPPFPPAHSQGLVSVTNLAR